MWELFIGTMLVVSFLFWIWWQSHTTSQGAPYVGMEPDVVERIMKMTQITTKDVFYDLGSGDGRVVISAGLHGAISIGVELDKLRVLYSKIWVTLLGLNKRVTIHHNNFYNVPLSGATIVCTYLLPSTQAKLKHKLLTELKPGTKLIAVGFRYEGLKEIERDPRGGKYGPIFLYKI